MTTTAPKPTIDDVLGFVANHYGRTVPELLDSRPMSDECRLALWLAAEYTLARTREIAEATGLSKSKIAQALKAERSERADCSGRNAVEDAMVDHLFDPPDDAVGL